MKKIFFPALIIAATLLLGCNSNSEKSGTDHENTDHSSMSEEMHATSENDKEVKAVQITFTSVDPGVILFMKDITSHYITIKNALVAGNTPDAATAATGMIKTLKSIDKSLFTAEQKKIYDGVETDLKENAEHISDKNDLEHKRSHFVMLSEDMYDLVKAFGAGMTLYHDHCPMARNNQGAMWLSETKEIRNPYFGDKMMSCGSVEEVFQ